MSKSTCSIEGCASPHLARSWCSMHYYRWYTTGTLTKSNGGTVAEKLARNTIGIGGCLIWTAAKFPDGYGSTWDGSRVRTAHSLSWEMSNGPVPDGMFLDHVCHNRACVKVAHLRLATREENRRHLRGAHRNSRTGIRGVYGTSRGTYIAKVTKSGTTHYLGTFEGALDAESAVIAKREELFGEYAGRSRRI